MDTFLASLPEDWSEYLTQAKVVEYVGVFGKTLARTRIDSYLTVRRHLKNVSSLAAKSKSMPTPIEDSRTIHYNRRPPKAVSLPVLGKGKKLTGTYTHVILDDLS